MIQFASSFGFFHSGGWIGFNTDNLGSGIGASGSNALDDSVFHKCCKSGDSTEQVS